MACSTTSAQNRGSKSVGFHENVLQKRAPQPAWLLAQGLLHTSLAVLSIGRVQINWTIQWMIQTVHHPSVLLAHMLVPTMSLSVACFVLNACPGLDPVARGTGAAAEPRCSVGLCQKGQACIYHRTLDAKLQG